LKVKIVITNDDGIEADGIKKLVKRLSIGKKVFVVAPDKDSTGISGAVTFNHPIKVEKFPLYLGERASYKVFGTPADCVILANDILVKDFDLLIAGINSLPNVGDDVRLSGTLGSCREAAFSGVPSFGISVEYGTGKEMFEGAVEFSAYLVEFLKRNRMPEGVFLNINVPNIPIKEIRGVRFVKQGRRRYKERVHELQDPSGTYYRIFGKLIDDKEKDTENYALKNNFIAITPMSIDETDYTLLEKIREKWKIKFPI